jgi:hypothetical protein
LPPDFTKKSDSRAARFVAEHGDITVALDALPVDALRARIVEAVEARMDLEALERTRASEARDKARLNRLFTKAAARSRGKEA